MPLYFASAMSYIYFLLISNCYDVAAGWQRRCLVRNS